MPIVINMVYGVQKLVKKRNEREENKAKKEKEWSKTHINSKSNRFLGKN